MSAKRKQASVRKPRRSTSLCPPGIYFRFAGGFELIHTPGHCAGHVALLWRPGQMLFAGDVSPNLIGLGDPVWFREFGGRPREPAQTCKSFIRCGRFSAMAGLSFAMRPRDCAISGARNRVPDWETPAMGGKRTPHFSCVALRKRRFVPWQRMAYNGDTIDRAVQNVLAVS
jgi:hypothetical protein